MQAWGSGFGPAEPKQKPDEVACSQRYCSRVGAGDQESWNLTGQSSWCPQWSTTREILISDKSGRTLRLSSNLLVHVTASVCEHLQAKHKHLQFHGRYVMCLASLQ